MAAPQIKTALRNATMGLAALGGVAGASAQALADDANVQQVAAVQNISIPVRDMQGRQTRGVQMSAAMVSKGTQVLIFYGDDQTALNQTFFGAKQAVASGVPLAGVIVASPASPDTIDGRTMTGLNRIEFYADGQRIGALDHVDREPNRLANLVRQDLERGHDMIESRRRIAMAPSASR